jgi:hypothetical protein
MVRNPHMQGDISSGRDAARAKASTIIRTTNEKQFDYETPQPVTPYSSTESYFGKVNEEGGRQSLRRELLADSEIHPGKGGMCTSCIGFLKMIPRSGKVSNTSKSNFLQMTYILVGAVN